MNLPTSNTSTSGNAPSLPVMQSCGSRRSQPDSGIDPDRTSEGSEENGLGVADEYLRQLGVEERRQGEEQPTNSLVEHSEEAFLDELVYAPLEEIFGIHQQQKGENERWMPPRKQCLIALSQPVIVGESRNLEDVSFLYFYTGNSPTFFTASPIQAAQSNACRDEFPGEGRPTSRITRVTPL